jgi:sec-independent protein translocase protein TatA
MELAVIAIIALVVLGPNKLPEAARSLGKGMREMRDSFQDAAQGHDEDDHLEHESVFAEPEQPEEDPEFEPQPVRSDADADAEEKPHQKEADSSVPSSSSSSTERE